MVHSASAAGSRSSRSGAVPPPEPPFPPLEDPPELFPSPSELPSLPPHATVVPARAVRHASKVGAKLRVSMRARGLDIMAGMVGESANQDKSIRPGWDHWVPPAGVLE